MHLEIPPPEESKENPDGMDPDEIGDVSQIQRRCNIKCYFRSNRNNRDGKKLVQYGSIKSSISR